MKSSVGRFFVAAACALLGAVAMGALPSGYVQLEYIGSYNKSKDTAPSCWLETDVVPTSGWRIEAVFAPTSTVNGCVFCARGSQRMLAWYAVNNKPRLEYFNNNFDGKSSLTLDEPHTFTINGNLMYIDGALFATGNTSTFAVGGRLVFLGNYSAAGANPSNGGATGKFYSAKVWDDNHQLRLDIIPVRRASDDALGVYDLVSDKFIGNSGTGTFTAGPEADNSDRLTIVGDPSGADVKVTGLTSGDARTCTVPAVVSRTSYKTSHCTGWKLYRRNGADWELADSGATSTCAYVHNGTEAKLEWEWSATYAPQAGATILYVSTRGSDANDGSTPDQAFKTIEHAIAQAASDATTYVYVEPGTYEASGTTVNADGVIYMMLLDKPVKVVATEGPARTFVDATIATARAYAKLTHADAVVDGFSFYNGAGNGKNRPSGIEGTAGLITNCVLSVRSQWAHQGFLLNLSSTLKACGNTVGMTGIASGENGAVVYMKDNALVDGLVVTNFTWSGSNGHNIIYAEGDAIIRNALIGGCQMGTLGAQSLPSFVCLKGNAMLEDSTVANNKVMAPNGAIEIGSKTAKVNNCIVWGNETTASVNCDFRGGSNKARVFRTCSAELEADETTGNTPQDPQFVDMYGGDYHLRAISRSADRGAVWLRPSGVAAFECAADATSYVSESGVALTTILSGYTSSGDEGVTAVWDFGDGTTSTDWPTATHTYETPGAYTVKLTVTKGGEAAVFTFARQFVTTPATCYVKEGATGVYPYDTWEKATASLAEAYAVGSRAIVVTNGTYDIAVPELAIGRALSLTSVEGPSKTTLNSLGGTTCDHRSLTVSGSDDILISGFTFTDGYALNYGWTAVIEMSAGTLSNCVVKSTRRVSRSAANYFFGTAKVVDCLFDGHGMTWSNDTAIQSGVRVEGNATLDRCEITAYRIENCTIASAYDGESPVRIASSGAVVRNSLIHHCTNGVSSAEKHRGPVALLSGRIENCTIVDNYCGGYGGGVWATGGTIVNSIICNNTALMGGKDLWSTKATPSIRYSCASDFANWVAGAGEGCTTKVPTFDATNAYHLTALATSCLNKGSNEDAKGDYDLDRLPRIFGEGVDLGCYEFAGSTDIPLDGTVAVVGARSGRLPYTGVFELSPVGSTNGLAVVWDFGTGEPVAGGLVVTNTFTTAGSYAVSVSFSNDKGESKTAAIAEPVLAVPQVCYVSTDGSNTAPYDNWETAANDILTVVALNPKTVLVSNGVYKVSGDGIILSTDLELRSVNGPDVTFIDAQETCRNVWLTGEGAVCDGFSLIRGTGYWDTKGAFACVQAGALSHCILSNGYNQSYRDSAVFVKDKGRMVDCVVDTASMGGNADSTYYWGTVVQSGGVIERCTIQRYSYKDQGGVYSTHFAVHVEGTGIFRNCLVKDCIATQSAGANACRGAIGVSGDGVVENCTVVNTTSCQQGGAITIMSTAKENPTVRNNVCWNSTLSDGTPADDVRDLVAATPRVSYCRANNLTDGVNGNLTADPILTTKKNRPAHSLGSASPCINAGLPLDWMEGATDLLGRPRLVGKRPDMGCYECAAGGFLLIVR